MAEIELTLPTVAYGNVKVRATPEELGVDIASPAAVGTATAIYLNLFTQGFKVGASMDVTASPTEGLSAPLAVAQSEVDRVIEETVKAAQILADGLGGATEVDEYDSATEAKEQWQDTDYAPWDQKVAAQPKPWETSTAPKVRAGAGQLAGTADSKPVQSVSELISDEW